MMRRAVVTVYVVLGYLFAILITAIICGLTALLLLGWLRLMAGVA